MFSASKTASPSGYTIQRSVRFRSSASAYFARTPASNGNQKTWTWSCWLKSSKNGANQLLLNTAVSGSSFGLMSLSASTWRNANDTIHFESYVSNVAQFAFETTPVYRDPSSWYHIVINVDTTQATSTNRVKIYVNGVQITAFATATYPSLNLDVPYFNSTTAQQIGTISTGGGGYLDGYLTEINFIDGQALTPTSFGAYNSTTGVWQPIKYNGTYGTNGFYLNFQDNSAATAAAIGKDSSGNGNNWTPNNISVTAGTTYDSMLDVPTLNSVTNANFPTLNAVSAYSGLPISAANLQTTAVPSGANWFSRSTTMGISTGKIYAEFSMPSITSGAQGNPVGFGIMPSSVDFSAIGQQIGNSGYGYGFYCPDTAGTSPKKIVAGTITAVGTGTATTTTDIFMVAFDLTNGNGWFGKNGTWYAGDPSAGTGASITGITAGEYIFGLSVYRDGTYTNNTAAINFGQRPFTYTPPSGFKSLNTYNLPAPTIPNGARQFAATTYTGNASTQSITNTVNSVSFQPDFIWAKTRSLSNYHGLWDSVRGGNNLLFSNATDAEAAAANLNMSVNSTGWSMNGNNSSFNPSGATIVGWQWKASNAAAVTNTSGSISSQVSANPTAGFSIITYTGTGANATVGHGLNITPTFIIIKSRSAVTEWGVFFGDATRYLLLSTTGAAVTSSTFWNNTNPTGSTFSLGSASTVNFNATTYVAYVFSTIAGYSKFGSYTGNGSTDGPFVYLGFRPRWIMFKKSSATSNWSIVDTSRDTFNVTDNPLLPNTSGAETTSTSISGAFLDILSNGFKLRGNSGDINDNTATYIYAAFAENPFNYSLAC